jgi:hypothetical protein
LTSSASSCRFDGRLNEKGKNMSHLKTRLAVAAAFVALSSPAFAASGIDGDPTFPAIENPAPAIALRGQGNEAEGLLSADPTFPVTGNVTPAIALVKQDSDRPQVERPADWAPKGHYAVELAPAQAQRVAQVK